MALSDVSGPSALVTGAGLDIGRWVAQQLARPRTGLDPVAAGGSRWDDHAPPQALASPGPTSVGPAQQTIDRPTPTVGIREVLTAWRAAERELGEIPEGSPERPDVQAKLADLRASYHQLFNEIRDRRSGVEDGRRDEGRPVMANGYQLFEVS